MTTKSKLALIAAIAAVSFASPVLAQSFDPEFGSGNVLPFAYEQTTSQHQQNAVRPSGLYDFAMVPRAPQVKSNPNDPAFTGGGSLGYNELLLIH